MRYSARLELDRWRVFDRRFDEPVENATGRVRRFFKQQTAERFAAALNRGNRRPSGTRA